MNDKRARNRMAAVRSRSGGPAVANLRVPGAPGRWPAAWALDALRHRALTERRCMLARLDAAGWPRELARRLLPLYPAGAVNPAWAARRDAWVRQVYGLELLRHQADHHLPEGVRLPAAAPPRPAGFADDAGPGGLLRRVSRRVSAVWLTPLVLVWLLGAALPARAAAAGAAFPPPQTAAAAPCSVPPAAAVEAESAAPFSHQRWGKMLNVPIALLGGNAQAATPRYEQPGRPKIEVSTPVLDGLYLRRVLAENEYPRIGAGVVGDANFDGKLDIGDAVYILSGAEPFNINGFAADGHFVVGDTTPSWGRPVAGQTAKMYSDASVLNLNDVDILFRYCFGRDGVEGIHRNPVVRAGAQRTLHSLVENALGVSGEVDPRIGVAYYDVRLADGGEPTAEQLSRVFVTAKVTADGRTMVMIPVKAGEFEVIGASSIVPLPADVENQEATLVLPNPHPNPAVTRVKIRGPSGPTLGTKDYTTSGFGVLRSEPFSDLGVAPEDGCYIEAYTYSGMRDVIPSLILFDKNSGSVTNVPSKKVFEGTTEIFIPFVANKSLTIDGKEYTFETDTFVNNYGQENGAMIVYGFYEDGVDHYPTPGLLQGDVVAIGEQKTVKNILQTFWGAQKCGFLNEGGTVGGKLKWGLTRMTGPDGMTALTSTPAVTSASDATGNIEKIINGLERDTEKKTGVRLIQTNIPSDGTVTLGVYGNGSFLGYKTLTSQSFSATTVDDIFTEFLGPDAVVKNGAVRVIANSGSFQAFGQTWNKGSMLWTPGQNYDHGENTRPEMSCINYLNADALLCDTDHSGQIDNMFTFSPTGVLKRFQLLGSDVDNDDLHYTFDCATGPIPEGVELTPGGYLTIQPMQQYSGQQFILKFDVSDGINTTSLYFPYRVN